MKTLIAVSLACLVAVSLACVELDSEWEDWKLKYSKTYENSEVEEYRRLIWENAHDFVEKFNAGGYSHTVELNHFADMTNKEYRTTYLGFNNLARLKSTDKKSSKRNVYVNSGQDPPTSVDWRSKGLVTPVKNQGQCGSCWAFSTTGSMEGQYAKIEGKLVSFSEQELMDCSGSEGNEGCQGGLMDNAFKYLETHSLESESEYPYVAEDRTCKYNRSMGYAIVKSFTDIPKDSCKDLISACADNGPISVAMDASHMSFQMYHSGVYDPFFCSNTKLDHGVLMVGYNGLCEMAGSSSKPYYLIKNSWGESWGMQGYFEIEHNKCGIETSASFPEISVTKK